jgi:anaphase-promoting complex subunit 8
MWSTSHTEIFRDRMRDSVECLKRALLGADSRETAINLKLAKLYEELEEPAEAVAYHRRVVEICRGEGDSVFSFG